ncbi:hypothetical protein NW739_05320 [Mycoplasmopsis felis]|nr:hypothetical protein [Mycoplasmopsis felis]MCU9940094.1 hypothetical protein [Mycoplasmopsis felis]
MSTTLSGGEAQRVKLATYLQKNQLEKQFMFLMNQQQDFIFTMLKN